MKSYTHTHTHVYIHARAYSAIVFHRARGTSLGFSPFAERVSEGSRVAKFFAFYEEKVLCVCVCVYVFVWRSRLDGWKNHFASGGLTDGEVCVAKIFSDVVRGKRTFFYGKELFAFM